jgi:hypothetical protein
MYRYFNIRRNPVYMLLSLLTYPSTLNKDSQNPLVDRMIRNSGNLKLIKEEEATSHIAR